MKTIKIGKYIIGKPFQPFIIAEAGVNHNGRLDLALKLIDAAAAAGAHAVKFQTFKAEQVVIPDGKMASYQKKNTKQNVSQLKFLKKLELKESFYKTIIKHCQKRKIIFLSTPHGGIISANFLNSLNIPAFKIGSGDLTNLPLLSHISKFKKPIIISTGMANLKEVLEAHNTIIKTGNHKIIILHCTSNYPCPEKEVNLNAMITLMKKMDIPIGFSDHTTTDESSIIAVTLGACMIEKHFTLSRRLPGPDHVASLEPLELKNFISKIQNIKTILGSFKKEPTTDEIKIARLARKSLVTSTFIKKGEKISPANIEIKRPGTGLPPKYFHQLMGKKAKHNLKANILIRKNDFI